MLPVTCIIIIHFKSYQLQLAFYNNPCCKGQIELVFPALEPVPFVFLFQSRLIILEQVYVERNTLAVLESNEHIQDHFWKIARKRHESRKTTTIWGIFSYAFKQTNEYNLGKKRMYQETVWYVTFVLKCDNQKSMR